MYPLRRKKITSCYLIFINDGSVNNFGSAPLTDVQGNEIKKNLTILRLTFSIPSRRALFTPPVA